MHCQSPVSSPKPANCCFHHLAVATERPMLSGAGTLLVRQRRILGLWQVFLSWNSVTLEYRLWLDWRETTVLSTICYRGALIAKDRAVARRPT